MLHPSCCRPPFIRIGDFHITYPNFQKSLKPRAQICNEVMSLFIETFNIEQLSSSKKQKKFAFSVLMSVSSSIVAPFYCHQFSRVLCPICRSYPSFFLMSSPYVQCVAASTLCPPRSFWSECLCKRAEEGVPKFSDFRFRPSKSAPNIFLLNFSMLPIVYSILTYILSLLLF